MIGFVRSKSRHARPDIHRTGITEIGGWLKNGTFLSVIKCDFFNVVQRELPEVYLSVLCVAQFDTVVEHAQMMGAHASDVHRFESAHATVIFQL